MSTVTSSAPSTVPITETAPPVSSVPPSTGARKAGSSQSAPSWPGHGRDGRTVARGEHQRRPAPPARPRARGTTIARGRPARPRASAARALAPAASISRPRPVRRKRKASGRPPPRAPRRPAPRPSRSSAACRRRRSSGGRALKAWAPVSTIMAPKKMLIVASVMTKLWTPMRTISRPLTRPSSAAEGERARDPGGGRQARHLHQPAAQHDRADADGADRQVEAAGDDHDHHAEADHEVDRRSTRPSA